MEQHEPAVIDPAPLPVARLVEPEIDLRTRAQKACDKLPSCDAQWCDFGGCDLGCELPCALLEVLSGLDVGCV
ncbi:MAG: hypothetical protein AB7T06_35450 [Kofleriaceae bacterium]